MARQVQTNLTSGEISKHAAARFDREFYFSGAESLENLLVLIEGGAARAPGTRHVAAPKHHDRRFRLIPFVKSNEDVVVIEAGEGYFRFFNAASRAPIVVSGSPYERVTPYSLTQLDYLYWWQSASVMFVTCKTGDVAPRSLIRFAETDWSFSPLTLANGPFLPVNATTTTLDASGSVGNVTISASAPVFSAGHVGALFRLWPAGFAVSYKKWKPDEESLSPGILREHEGRIYNAASSGTCSNQPPVHESGTASDGSISWEFISELSGIVSITGYSSPTSVQAAVRARLDAPTPPHSNPPATKEWAEGFFSTQRGWPFVGCNFDSRLYFFGAPDFPDSMWATRTDGFNPTSADFKQSDGLGTVEDDHAVVRTLNDGEVNRIAWALPGEQIVLGHANGVVRVSGPSLNEPITPFGASARRPDAPPGSNFRCRAVRAGERIVYASKSGRRLIALNPLDFSFETITARARDKGAARFIELAYALETENRLFALREDGRLFVCAFDSEQKVTAWSAIAPAGKYQGDIPPIDTICVVPGPTGRDELWYGVTRTINGVTRRAIEVMDADFIAGERLADEAVFGDGAVTVNNWNADPAKTITLTIAGGPLAGEAAALRDGTATLSAQGFTFTASWIGKEVRLRRRHAQARRSDSAGEISCRIVSQTGLAAQAVLLADVPAGLYGKPLYQYAQAQTTISGLAHLDGETVGVWGDGADLGDFTVAGGAIDLGADSAVARACAGLRKPWKAVSLPLVMQLPDGLSIGQSLRASEVFADLLDTASEGVKVSVIVDGRESDIETLAPRDSDDPISAVTPLREGVTAQPVGGGKGVKVQVKFAGDGMGPATMRALGLEFAP